MYHIPLLRSLVFTITRTLQTSRSYGADDRPDLSNSLSQNVSFKANWICRGGPADVTVP